MPGHGARWWVEGWVLLSARGFPFNLFYLVAAAGVEPASKQGAPRLSTRLFCAWSSCAGWPQTTWPFAAVS